MSVGEEREDHHSFGMFSAIVFNMSLLILPIAAGITWAALQNTSVYSYEATASTKARTRAALDRVAASLIQRADGADRHAAWNAMIQHEMDDHDFDTARGLLLAAPAMLPPAEGARLTAQIPPDATDAQRISLALAFLNDGVRSDYQQGASVGAPPRMSFSLLGDRRQFADEAGHEIAGEGPDPLAFALDAIGATLAGAPENRLALAGASLIKATRNAGKLSPDFAAQLKARLDAALPPARMQDALRKALANVQGEDPSEAAVKAVAQSIDPAGLARLKVDLVNVAAIADGVSANSAPLLLEHAQSDADLPRLRLIAVAGGDRAVAVAKLADDARLLGAAKGALQMSGALWLDFTLLSFCALGVAASLFATMGQALLREWRHSGAHAHGARAEA